MEVIVFLLATVLFVAESGAASMDDVSDKHAIAFVDADEGDVGQIFGTSPIAKPIVVVVEKPVVQAQVDCYKTTELVRDLTIPYRQRSYIQSDGTSCTPVE